jgi:putative ABC transport system permease protein
MRATPWALWLMERCAVTCAQSPPHNHDRHPHATLERQLEYGVLKAVGARNRFLYRVVATQALAAALAGSALGVLAALGAAWLIMALRPQFLITVEPTSGLLALAAGLGMALLAALFPARMLARLAPAEVFRR